MELLGTTSLSRLRVLHTLTLPSSLPVAKNEWSPHTAMAEMAPRCSWAEASSRPRGREPHVPSPPPSVHPPALGEMGGKGAPRAGVAVAAVAVALPPPPMVATAAAGAREAAMLEGRAAVAEAPLPPPQQLQLLHWLQQSRWRSGQCM